MKADLHIHTVASDGCYTVAELLVMAENAGLEAIAITDHDTVAGLTAFGAESTGAVAAGKTRLIPGVELSIDFPAYEVHILGYFLRLQDPILLATLDKLAQYRQERMEKMIKKLNYLGYNITYPQVQAIAGKAAAVGRPHVAQALVNEGYFLSVQEAFNRLLKRNAPAYVPHYKLSLQEAVDLIYQAGGITVLAHPGLIGSDKIVCQVIDNGVKGLEVYYPEHTTEQTSRYLALACARGLAITGGSDFHGLPGRFPARLGDFYISSCLVTQLEKVWAGNA